MSYTSDSMPSFQWPYTLSPHDSGMVIEDVWPTLFFGTERLEEIQRKHASLPWAQRAVAQMIQEADAVIQRPPQVPIEQVGWRHDFYSHRTGEHLVYDPESPNRFYDPWDGSFHTSEAQRRAWVLLTHERTFRIMRSLGFLYGLTGEERYAEWVVVGLRSAVEMFQRDDLRNEDREGALYFQPLYDAQILLLLADAYALTRESPAYRDRLHSHIVRYIFEGGIPYQIRFFEKTGTHNMTCYVAAALARVGQLLARSDWIEMGLNDPQGGLMALLQNGLRSDDQGQVDGFWFEGTQFYHFYSLCPLVALFEMSSNRNHLAADVRARFERMFEAPLKLADPEGQLLCLGDLAAPKGMHLSLYRHLYEYAAGQLDNEKYGPVLSAIYTSGIPRNSLCALAYGPDTLPSSKRPKRSGLLRSTGIGVFQGSTKEGDFYAYFKAGKHGAGHDHADKLSIGLHALGQVIATDLGTAGYAIRDFREYCRSTFGHNTLIVDERDQSQVERASLQYSVRQARGIVEDAYEGVRLERRLRFDPPFLFVEDRCVSEEPHRYGWVFHAYGSLSTQCDREHNALGLPPIPEEGPFAWFTNRWTMTIDGVLCADWRVSDHVWLRLLIMSDGPFEATLGRTPGHPIPDDQGTVLLRAPGPKRSFQAVFEVHRGTPSLDGWSEAFFDWTQDYS